MDKILENVQYIFIIAAIFASFIGAITSVNHIYRRRQAEQKLRNYYRYSIIADMNNKIIEYKNKIDELIKQQNLKEKEYSNIIEINNQKLSAEEYLNLIQKDLLFYLRDMKKEDTQLIFEGFTQDTTAGKIEYINKLFSEITSIK
jgi:hypothetical protein